MDQNFLERIADALDRLSPIPLEMPVLEEHDVFLWHANPDHLEQITNVASVDMQLLVGIDSAKASLLKNTIQFAEGMSANNALLWGSRGTGKSSLVKSVHAEVILLKSTKYLKLVEIHREDISDLPELLTLLSKYQKYKFILLCDDLSFDAGENTYKSLKAALDGGIEGKPNNVVFYATSNRRHLMPRDMVENEQSTAINPSESVEEKVSLSDRFGLWIGFHNISQEIYLDIVIAYINEYKIPIEKEKLKSEALEWSITRGARSGRVAWQFIQDIAGKTKTKII